MKFALFAGFLVCAYCANDPAIPPDLTKNVEGAETLVSWNDFVKKYNKIYDFDDETRRYKIFVENSMKIENHNVEEALDGRHGFNVAVNQFADLTTTEFVAKYAEGYWKREAPSQGSAFLTPSNVKLINDSVDWRDHGCATSVKDQGQCRSGWSFSAAGSLEFQQCKNTGVLEPLSAQNLVDCVKGNHGCSGGRMDHAFEYAKESGIDTEMSYPYTAKNGTCNAGTVGANCTGYVNIPSKNETALQVAVHAMGPVSAAIDASNWRFQFYSSGVYNESSCSQDKLGHGVLIMGYGAQAGRPYWLVKNSFGEDWGDKGYILMGRNRQNQCGIATEASYPLV